MALPVDLPGFAFRKARLAVSRLVETLAFCADQSKATMKAGEETTCLVDFWMQETMKAAAEKAGEPAPPHTASKVFGGHLFDFLFASQDASTSSLLWAVTLLDSHPEVFARVREEVAGIWWPESDRLITAEELREMKYTEAVAREVIRFRAPATMVPHIAGEEFRLSEDYVIPKGAIVFPSRYAGNHLVLFIALFTSLIDFKRHRTDGCDEIAYVPTICPKDNCKVFLSTWCTRFPSLS
ncbi:hypothetical protein RJ640_024437 [Escallonia rubra]|uniref:C-22 sterol desaturase n=1 Tax=Escallonia rubra TaxID=112253 RepID=A0AA88UJW7_9ASTE|nr:hypothetical protein RJ640_024437 [Escallonia rubra]